MSKFRLSIEIVKIINTEPAKLLFLIRTALNKLHVVSFFINFFKVI